VSHAAHIYWANGSNIGRANLDGTGVNQSFIAGANADTVVVKNNHLYWENHNGQGDLIGRANLDGSGVNQGFVPGSLIYGGLAVNNNYIYWSGGTILSRANIDGTSVDQNFITNFGIAPGGLAANNNYVYWVNNGGGTIGRANFDGTGVNQSFITGLSSLGAIAVGGNYIYWTSSSGINRASLDGAGVNLDFINAAYTSAVVIGNNYIYWASGDSIGRANLDGTGANKSFITSISSISDIAVDTSATPSPTPGFVNVSATFGQPSPIIARLPMPAGTGDLRAESATISWGDGSITPATLTPGSGGGANVAAVHTYWVAGSPSLTVTLTGPSGSTNYYGHADVASTYVGMGDSYSSGEGAHWTDGGPPNAGCNWSLYTDYAGNPASTDFILGRKGSKCDQTQIVAPTGPTPVGPQGPSPPTQQPNNTCHRAITAYPHVLTKTLNIPGMTLKFVACSGDTVHNAYVPPGDDKQREIAQVAGLSHRDSLVTMSFGGNDLDFSGVVTTCATPRIKNALDCLSKEADDLGMLGFDTKRGSPSDGQLVSQLDTPQNNVFSQRLLERLHLPSYLHCLLAGGACMTQALTSLFARADPTHLPAYLLSATDAYSQALNLHDRLVLLLRVVKALAPGSRILILGYPRWFPEGGGPEGEHISTFEQTYFNDRIAVVDGVIRDAAIQSGVAQYVNVYNAFSGHEEASSTTVWPVDPNNGNATCNGPGGTYINGIDLIRGLGGTPEVMHPNPCGHQAFAARAADAFHYTPETLDYFSLASGQTHHGVVSVTQGASRVTITAQWSGAGLTTSLTAPNGKNVAGALTPTLSGAVFATWTLVSPTPGSWKLSETNASSGGGAITGHVAVGLPQVPQLPPGADVTVKHHKIKNYNGQTLACHATFEAHVSNPASGVSFSWFDDQGSPWTAVSGDHNMLMTMDSDNNHFQFVLRINGTNGEHRYEPIDMSAC